ncbi:MAG: cytochrome C554, partial [Acidobacteria bacterium]
MDAAARKPDRASLGAAVTALAFCAAVPAAPQEAAPRPDPAKVRGAEACRECHVSEYEVWRRTPHATGFKTLHRKAAAEAIAQRLGLRLIKRHSPCLGCHYTPTLRDGEERALSGVSCESCHGAARDWIDVHNDYGAGNDHRSEPPEHRASRIAGSRAAGMRRASQDLYALASSCFGCHTVPDERLVNAGGHGTGSADFELVAWSQGEVRHNFLHSFLTGDGSANAERPPAFQRRLYVLGRALDLEHSLRGMAAASERGTYASAMGRRVRLARNELRAIGRRAELPEIEAMLAAVRGVEVEPGNRGPLLAAAAEVGRAAQRFLAARDGGRLAALDPLLHGEVDGTAFADADGGPASPPAAAPE